MRLNVLLAAGCSAGALAIAIACSSSTSSNCGSGTPPSLVGTYALQSLTIGAATPLTPPAETGTLRFHASTYAIALAGALAQADTGNYTVTGSSCIAENGLYQFTGTFNLSGTTLTVSGAQSNQAVASVWTKTS
ncbi:MAG TPA: hypothetical protein VEH62_04725 [Gemmatimonadales bacterium]|nr:hypothetical protein [Gemmatimonadales bacterium]